MKKTNILVEVDDDLYENIVLPYKKKKSFGKLVVQLLTAYYENESIYSYINGAIDEMHDEAKEELLKDLQSMANSLNSLGMLQNEAEVTVDNGFSEFKDFGNTANTVNTEDYNESNHTPEITKEDVVNIVNDSLKDIKSMLDELLHKGVVNQTVANTVSDAVDNHVSEAVNSSIHEELSVSRDDIIVHEPRVVVREQTKEEEEKAQSALSSLLGSLGDY